MGRMIVVAMMGALGLVAGCEDKAQPDFERCVHMAAPCACTAGDPLCSCPPGADLKAAWDACNAAVVADPNSKSGKLAAAKLGEIKPRLDTQRAEAEKARALAAQAEAAGRAAQAAQDAKCSSWTTICTLGKFPDGSERTTGLQHFGTKAKCQEIGAEMGGIPCDPCRCAD